jgi:hypothetical protein
MQGSIGNALGIAALLLMPAVFAGRSVTRTSLITRRSGAVLAINMCLLARRIQHFSPLLPLVYVAAAVTAESTDGVAALIVAIAAAVGAASSRGYHRALLSVLAAALLGSIQSPLASTRSSNAVRQCCSVASTAG